MSPKEENILTAASREWSDDGPSRNTPFFLSGTTISGRFTSNPGLTSFDKRGPSRGRSWGGNSSASRSNLSSNDGPTRQRGAITGQLLATSRSYLPSPFNVQTGALYRARGQQAFEYLLRNAPVQRAPDLGRRVSCFVFKVQLAGIPGQ